MNDFRVTVLTERGNCLFDYDPDSLNAQVDTKDWCRLVASLANLTELEDFRFLRMEIGALTVLTRQVWTTRRGDVLWSYAKQGKDEPGLLRLVLLKLFVLFLRNCSILQTLVESEKLETQRVSSTQSMNFTYRSVVSEASVVEAHDFPQYRALLSTFEPVYSRFKTAFADFRGCVFDYSSDPLYSHSFDSTAHILIETIVRKLQEDITTDATVRFN